MQTVQLIRFWGNLDIMTNVLSTADLPIANVTYMMIKFWWKRQGTNALENNVLRFMNILCAL